MINPLLRSVYEDALVIPTGKYETTVDEFGDQIPALRPEVLEAAAGAVFSLGKFEGNKILVEEDKGAPLGTMISVMSRLPLAVARWYPYQLPGEAPLAITSEYFTGHLYLNGIEPGDRVILVDDAVSTGGTLAALIGGVRKKGAEVTEALTLIDKVDYGGRPRIWREFGIEVKSAFGIRIVEGRVRVVEF